VRRAHACLRIAASLLLAAAGARAADEFRWNLPRGFPEPAVPADNPMNAAKVALGERLFSDARLSVTGRHSCASCHEPARAFTDGRALARGATGDTLPLNAPTLINAAYNSSLGWRDPETTTFEQQMLGPLFNMHPVELGLAGRAASLEKTFTADAKLRREFTRAFPGERAPVTMDNVIRAIAAYERTLLSASSPFDRYVFAGEHDALTAPQKRGMALFFGDAGCARCHGGINFSGEWVDREHPVARAVLVDAGTGERTRVPTLRNLPATAPYLHDGRAPTLDDVLDRYEALAHDTGADARFTRRALTTEERADIRVFLSSLDDAR
jgi:cytochrome c peroxidase